MIHWVRGVIAALLLAAVQPALAADIGVPPPDVEVADPAAATRAYLERYAVLLMIRDTFDVVEDVATDLAAEAAHIGDAPTAEDEALLDRNLMTEGSYYLVSLRYLVAVGGAAWPGDRAESAYANDALVTLDALEARLLDTVADRTDPLPLFVEAQQLLLLTEGITNLPADLDRFAGRDALVESVLGGEIPDSTST
jgi:hypothetical protein